MRLKLFIFVLSTIFFANCNHSDDNELIKKEEIIKIEEPLIIKKQENLVKSIEITQKKEDVITTSKVEFTYDNQNRLLEIKNLRGENLKYEYLSENSLVVHATDIASENVTKYIFALDSKTKMALSLQVESQDNPYVNTDKFIFDYNSKIQLSSITFTNKNIFDKETYIWSEDYSYPVSTVSQFDIEYLTFEGSEFLNNASIDINALISNYPNFIHPKYAVYSGHLGEKAKYLIKNVNSSVYGYDYIFNTNTKGLIEKVTIGKINKKENVSEITTYFISYN
ncbi:hypothetical protein [Flavobacterium sp. NKUCC04_CG]|uniref:hypothetical protein n=1 Tax=Flavobacterium sp. NKUCC04_CG TaxID=2842121 RepID=UPI001C5B2879|nr:hypothetical protein [Flavobacterium sp. NKUCC04_CG]MBW3518048.1 hypothetical protein [Flavobacterium sp. NKUCC04_CG]